MTESPPERSEPPAAPAGSRTRPPSLWKDLIVTGFGLATSAAVAWLSWWLASTCGFSVYTFMAGFVVPVGAIFCGMAAASGYWIGARLFNHRPTRALLLSICLVSIGTYFAIHYFHYTHDTVQGRPISKLMPFADYLAAVTGNMTYSSARHKGPDLDMGKFGWVIAALQIIGFSCGGFVVYSRLREVPYCDRCGRYFGGKQTRVAQWKDPREIGPAFEAVAGLMNGGHVRAAIDKHAALGDPRHREHAARLELALHTCPGCRRGRLSLAARVQVKNGWATVATTSVEIEEPLAGA